MYVLTILPLMKFFKHTFLMLLLAGLLLVGRIPFLDQPVALAQSGADLVIDSITVTPPTPGAGTEADITVVVKNQGTATSSGIINLYLYLNPAVEPPTGDSPLTSMTTYGIPLPAGATFTWTRTGQTMPGGVTKVYAYVDPPWENNVAESNEDNNLKLLVIDDTTPTPTPSVTPTPSGDEYEDDDTCQAAKLLTADGAEQLRDLYRDGGPDTDWVKFEGTANVTYYIEAIADGQDTDLIMQLYTECNLPSLSGGVKFQFTAPADGTYYLKIRPTTDEYGPDNGYRLKMTSDSGCTDNFEVNNSCSAAGQLAVGIPQTHAFCSPNDEDWLFFPVIGGTEYRVSATSQQENVDVALLVTNSCDRAAEPPGVAQTFTATEDGIYYIKTRNALGKHGIGTNYQIQVNKGTGPGPGGDSFENDNSRAAAKSVVTGASNEVRNFYPAGDEDWVKFNATANVTYTIETVNLASASDPVVCLFDSGDTEIACDDDSGAGEAARIVWSASQSGEYFIQIKNYERTAIGAETEYTVQIQEGSCTADGYEPDNSRQSARPLSQNNAGQQHNICPQADVDWVSFTATANTPYILETTNIGPDADTLLVLYDADGNEVARNDDHTPGGASQIAHTFAVAGTYYASVELYEATAFGTGTEYTLQLRTGSPTPTPTPSPPPPTVTPTATPVPAEAKSLILVNRARLAALYGEPSTAALMDKLNTLAAADGVQGTIVDLDQNSAIRSAYARWTDDIGNVDKANGVATAIRTLILNRWAEQGEIDYIVLVGEDQALPFYRIADTTDLYPEKTYGKAASSHATGAALTGNYYLSDDYYADQVPTSYDGHPLYIPDAAIGRLIETPQDMIRIIDAYLANPSTALPSRDGILISGYDFIQDMAANICTDWQTDFGSEAITNCSLIGPNWPGASLRTAQQRTAQPYKVQIIAGHADHTVEGAPDEDYVRAHELLATNGLDLAGALIYTPGCHAGLNIPSSDPNGVDLVQALTAKGANYIGHTGYGWGSLNGIGWSERLLELFTKRLLRGVNNSMGGSLTAAKQDYIQQNTELDAYDEKILQTMTFYGLPMFHLQSPAVLANPEEDFPGVQMRTAFPPNSNVIAVGLDFREALNNGEWFSRNNTSQGSYYELDQNTAVHAGQPVQPLHFGDIDTNQAVRGIVLRNATFRVENNFNPLVAAPYNEYSAVTAAATNNAVWIANNNNDAWYPPTLSTVQTSAQTTLVTQIGQLNPATNQLRIYESTDLELYYSDSSDQTPPTVQLVSAVINAENGQVYVKVGTTDTYGVAKVAVSYLSGSSDTRIETIDLAYSAGSQMWTGSFPGTLDARFFVQVVDNAGNVATAHNKGRYYAPTPTTRAIVAPSSQRVFLPLIVR